MTELQPTQEKRPVLPVAPLELQEYLFAETAVEYVSRATPVDGHRHVRETLRLHRFSLFSWLMQNGVRIPIELLADQNHPEVGKQYPDQ